MTANRIRAALVSPPSGLLKVISTDYYSAREDVFRAIGTAWAFIYDEANARHPSFRGLYGKGVTHVLEKGEIKPVDKNSRL